MPSLLCDRCPFRTNLLSWPAPNSFAPVAMLTSQLKMWNGWDESVWCMHATCFDKNRLSYQVFDYFPSNSAVIGMEFMEIMDCMEWFSLKLSTGWAVKYSMEMVESFFFGSESDVLPLDKSPILGFTVGDYPLLEGIQIILRLFLRLSFHILPSKNIAFPS